MINKTSANSEEALAALRSANDALQAVVKAVHPPLWLTELSTCFVATYMLSGFLLRDTPYIGSVIGITLFANLSLLYGHQLVLRPKGLGLSIKLKNSERRLVDWLILLAVLLFLPTLWAFKHGYGWTTWLFTAFICGINAYVMNGGLTISQVSQKHNGEQV